ncbi:MULTISPECIES: transposase, partial [Spirulina sp. CCY15215]|uniref:transposase n=1 Tax=Spirulina sp. CCY15215 TaxID=2767591 RepID=UPI0032AFF120
GGTKGGIWAKGMLSKHCLDAAFGQFITILKWVAWKRDVFVAEVDKNYTSLSWCAFPRRIRFAGVAPQICPKCDFHTGKKSLSEREHHCLECGYKTHRDIAAAEVIRDRGIKKALGHSVSENACGDDLTGALPSQKSVKQEILNASSRISR